MEKICFMGFADISINGNKWVFSLTCNQGVAGSSPAVGTKIFKQKAQSA